jgi:hypothetical protein
MMRRLANYSERPLWLTVGQVLDLGAGGAGRAAASAAAGAAPAASAPATSDQIVLTPAGQRVSVPAAQPAMALSEQGFYEIRRQARDAAPATVVAGNVDLAESDLTPLDPAEMVAAVTGQPGSGGPGAVPEVVPDEVQEQAQRIWWYLLFTGILILIGETVLAQRLSRVRT